MARNARRAHGHVVAKAFTARPSISGTAKVGQTLTAADGTVSGATIAGRQWMRDGVPIAGQTAATFIVRAGDVGFTIGVRVSATLTGGGSVRASSASTAPIIA